MCVIIAAPPGERIPRDDLLDACFENPDGFGFVISYRGNLISDRDPLDAKRIIDGFLREQDKHPECWGIFHARIATQGGVNEENTHPFQVPGEPWMLLHNGVMPLHDGPWGNRSDSRILAEDHIAGMTWKELQDTKAETEAWLKSNKVVLLSARRERGGRCIIWNEEKGHWSQRTSCWYSHHLSHARTRPRYVDGERWTGHGHQGTSTPAVWGGNRTRRAERTLTSNNEGRIIRATMTTATEGTTRGPGGELLPFYRRTVPAQTEGQIRLEHAADLLCVEPDDIRAWVGGDARELEKLVADVLDGADWLEDNVSDSAEDEEEEETETAPVTEQRFTPQGVPIIEGHWDPDTGLYLADDGRTWAVDPANDALLVPYVVTDGLALDQAT